MVSPASRPYIDASVPVLREHGLAITRTFYRNMFEAHPELTNLFNMGNQASGAQQQSLAAAVFAYVANIDNPAAAMPNLRAATFYEFTSGASAGEENVHEGLMDAARLPQWRRAETDVYMCGPTGFMKAQWLGLIEAGVPAARLHREVFGPEMLDFLE